MSFESKELLIGTRNEGKLAELSSLFAGTGIRLRSLNNFEDTVEVDETGLTFAENARLKAHSYALQTGMLTLADDSGLEVAALSNRPGVYSARYGGEGTGFDEKMAMLLEEMDAAADKDRRARFVCSIAVAGPDGKILHTVEGVCNGRIAAKPSGAGGFGYDPLFIPDGFTRTFGELPQRVKQEISHRAKAFREIIPFLLDFMTH